MPSEKALAICQDQVDTLRSTISCIRVTLRTQPDPTGPYPVLVEARESSAINSLLGDTTIDVRKANTFIACRESGGKILVQEDLTKAREDVVPPSDLMKVYGATAQMLCPIMKGAACLGVVSVHVGTGPRVFTDAERGAMIAATRTMNDALELGGTVREDYMMG